MEHIDLMGGLKLDSKGNAAIQAPFATLKGALEVSVTEYYMQ